MASKDTVKRSLALWDFSFERYKLGLDRGCVCMAFNASREGMWAKKGYIAAGNLYWEMPGIKLCMFLRSDHDQSVGGEWCHCSVAGQENSWPFHSFWGNKSWLMVDNHFCLPVNCSGTLLSCACLHLPCCCRQGCCLYVDEDLLKFYIFCVSQRRSCLLIWAARSVLQMSTVYTFSLLLTYLT